MKLELLPRKEFEFILDSGNVVKGKFGTWAAKRFCDKKQISIVQFIEKFHPEKIEEITFDDVTLLILCSVEYSHRKENKGPFPYTDIDACEWVEGLGGFGGEDYGRLFSHFASDVEGEEKKNQTGN